MASGNTLQLSTRLGWAGEKKIRVYNFSSTICYDDADAAVNALAGEFPEKADNKMLLPTSPSSATASRVSQYTSKDLFP
jgi:hypothetical protein